MDNGNLKQQFDVATALEQSRANNSELAAFVSKISRDFFREDEAAGKAVGDVADTQPSITLPYAIDAYKIQGMEGFHTLRGFCANPVVDCSYNVQTRVNEEGKPVETTVSVNFDGTYRTSAISNVSSNPTAKYESAFKMFF